MCFGNLKMIKFENVSYAYPFTEEKAIDSLSFEIKKGEVVLCTGGSGCGKSTLTRLINGLAPGYYKGRLDGRVSVAGIDNSTRQLCEITEDAGTLFQDPEQQFFALNVEDELAFSHEWKGVSPEDIRSKILRVSKEFSIEDLLSSSIFDLSEGEKQKVALASIVSLKPEILVLDEPTANLDPYAVNELASLLMKLKTAGMTIFIADHRLYWLTELVDRVMVLENGRLAAEGDVSKFFDDSIREKYGLRKAALPDSRQELCHAHEKENRNISVSDLCFSYEDSRAVFLNDSVSLPAGEVIAVLGENGVGKTTLARLLTGLEKADSGEFRINGRQVSPVEMLKRGAIVLQNTDHQLHMKTVQDELSVSLNGISGKTKEDRIGDVMDYFGLSGLGRRHPQSLSGGQKQRLVIACAAIREPDILVLDEPTSGLDGANMKLIADMMKMMAKQGTCVIVITHDLELINSACTCKLELPLLRISHGNHDEDIRNSRHSSGNLLRQAEDSCKMTG